MSNLLITVSGRPASGTTTIAKRLSTESDFIHISGGDIFRAKGFDNTDYANIDGDEVDNAIDAELAHLIQSFAQANGKEELWDDQIVELVDEYIDEREQSASIDTLLEDYTDSEVDYDGIVIESRLAGWLGKESADVRVWAEASQDTRKKRIEERNDESIPEMVERERAEVERYQKLYGYNLRNLEPYTNVVDTELNSVEETVDRVLEVADRHRVTQH